MRYSVRIGLSIVALLCSQLAFAQSFDAKNVDRKLYGHQKLGKTYKVMGRTYTPAHNPDYDKEGTSSWYGDKFHGKLTALGEPFDKNEFTAAHKTLPLNSMLRVTNLENGKTIMVRLNDRGPFFRDRIIDLSQASAIALDIAGLGNVRVQYAGPSAPLLDLPGSIETDTAVLPQYKTDEVDPIETLTIQGPIHLVDN